MNNPDDTISSPEKKWIYEFDILRCIAILFIMLHHAKSFYPVGQIGFLKTTVFGSIGLMIFFFISGFLIANVKVTNISSVLSVMKSRFLRLAPLFYLALILTVIFLQLDLLAQGWTRNLSFVSIIVHIFFLQIFVPSMNIAPLWFVSALLFFTLIFCTVKLFIKNQFYYTIALLFILFPLARLSYAGLLNGGVYNNYMFFVAGTFLGLLFEKIKGEVSLVNSVHPLIRKISYSSYAIYLFHILIFGVVSYCALKMKIANPYLVLLTGLVLSIIIPYYIQEGYDRISERIRMYGRGGLVKKE